MVDFLFLLLLLCVPQSDTATILMYAEDAVL